jgi:hypothetical protein
MPGYNHPSDCLCGWCYKEKSTPKTATFRAAAPAVEAITIPNASCPLCGASVFFYSNEYGSRVFFDSVGPPWPKHPCTDPYASGQPATFALRELASSLEPSWRPYRYIRSKFEDEWVALHLEDVESGALFRVLVERYLRVPVRHAVFVRSLDEHGYTWIEFLSDDLTVTPTPGWQYQRWYLATPVECASRRDLDEKPA